MTHELYQGDEIGGSKECCLLASSFDAKKSRSETECAFDSHTLPPSIARKLSIEGVTQTSLTLLKIILHI